MLLPPSASTGPPIIPSPVLNLSLYCQLVGRFGVVKLAKPGERNLYADITRDYQGRFYRDRRISHWGESYLVTCPFCGDEGQHLSINHAWCTAALKNSDSIAKCFHYDCLKGSPLRHKQLVRWIHAATPISQAEALEALSQISAPPTLPTTFQLLSRLPDTHPAVSYVRSHGFDPVELTELWRVGAVDYDDAVRPMLIGRIILPLFSRVSGTSPIQVAGWQALACYGTAEQRYLTAAGFSKSQHLYGVDLLDRLPPTCPVIVVEDPTHVWRIGRGAVALMSRTASEAQLQLLAQIGRQRPTVILLNRDAERETSVLVSGLRRHTREVIHTVNLPYPFTGPGQTPREVLWQVIYHTLANEGVYA